MHIPADHNLSLGERCHGAIVRAAEAKVSAMKARKLADRIYDRVLLTSEGKNASEREARARTDMAFMTADDAALETESAAIIAKAEADGLQVVFEQFRTNAATSRAEMQLR
jgi:hypothetical protein